ncbi:hypothetical protein [Persicobacter diffluens]|uniref:Uncharacterized protein n=1 Tax=Persicobacter diffluens TaxID=981 RepID=A0AAN4W1Y2_9BACT|nr:hypothetical protein PEDI_47430 [Persicobacter diffluens]
MSPYKFIIYFSIIILTNCQTSKTIDCDTVSENFYFLNRNKKFNALYSIAVASYRTKAIYNEETKKIDLQVERIDILDSVENSSYIIPIFKFSADSIEKRQAYSRLNKSSKLFFERIKGDPFNSYVEYVNAFHIEYNDIEIPESVGYSNISIEGNLKNGRRIIFHLTERCKLYYINEPDKLNIYWRKKINKCKKLDTNWYYDHEGSSL